MVKDVYAFGTWPSPISASLVAGSALRFGRVQAEGGAIYWSEGRPSEKGRAPVMRWTPEDGAVELLPPPYSARSRVHEYGGGEFLVAGGVLYFVNDADQDIYAVDLPGDAPPNRITAIAKTRFADMAWDAAGGRLIAVGETHGPAAPPQNALWSIPVGDARKAPAIALQGRDFYASPRISHDGKRLAFLAWDLPDMPWDAARLFVADIAEDGSFAEPVLIAGGDGGACFQPEWDGDGALYFVWDAAGLGNLYRWSEGRRPVQITRLEGDLSMPLWSFNAASYALLAGGKAYLSFVDRGETRSAIIDLGTGALAPHENGLTATTALSADAASVAIVGLADGEPLCVFRDDVSASGASAPQIIRRSGTLDIDPLFVSRPTGIAIPSERGEVYGLLYPPANPDSQGPQNEKPPLIINLHGGPTGAAARGLKPRTLFFTSRGFSWLDLDYSGSTGYGRAYRDRLKGNWGVADVEDAVSAARFAASEGLADARAIFVTGGSAGGYTVLMAIATAADVFRGAASHYGICDLVALQRTTHKFEQGYQSTLLGGSLDDHEALYRARSAIHHIETIKTPLILFQGAEDQVVPKEQSISIAEALRRKGLPVEYYEFEGEGHGFRRAETIAACLERELAFYRMLMADAS